MGAGCGSQEGLALRKTRPTAWVDTGGKRGGGGPLYKRILHFTKGLGVFL